MKYNFGKYAILGPVEHYFKKEPKWFWKIRAATSGDELSLQQFYIAKARRVTLEGKEYDLPPLWIETMYREIAQLFGGTNIPLEPDNPESAPILQDNANVQQVEAVLRAMPEEMVEELWDAVKETNPTWGPQRPAPIQSGPASAPPEPSTEASSSPA